MKKILVMVVVMLLVSVPTVFGQDFCKGDFDYDGDVDADDVGEFLNHFGRFEFNNPCPPDGPAPVPKTWQWISYSTGDDGDYEHGAMWPIPRFTDNGDGTVTDNLTGLMWLKDANCISSWYPGFDNDGGVGDGEVTWQHALDFVAGINDGSYTNCGGNPPYNDWRFSNLKELQSLIHYGFANPALPCTAGPCHWGEGDPFINVINEFYWSSTSFTLFTNYAWLVYMGVGYSRFSEKDFDYNYVWPVRGGH